MKSNSEPKLKTSVQPTSQATPPAGRSFADLGISADFCALIKELGYETPTPIQLRAIPPLLAGKDIIGQAQTGTGKTAAFALPLLSKIDFDLEEPQVLVLTPTRELAIQVAEAFKTYARHNESFHVLPIYGGQSISIQLRQLRRQPQVIVGTPGRVMDHLERKSLSLGSLRALVIDEADEMLSMGFLEDMEWIITHTPKEKQVALFSATMPHGVKRIAQSYLRKPEEIIIKQVASQKALINQSCWFVDGLHKLDALTRILELNEFDAMLIFVRTKTSTIELGEKLGARGYSVGTLNGDMTQEARERTIDRLRKGSLDIVVATDVAARGLDVERISHVINYDIPFDAEVYTHRIGRTGRAGRSGVAISFVSNRENGLLRSIERGAGQRLEKYPMPSREDISRRRTELFKAKVAEALLKTDLTEYLELVESIALENDTSEKNVAAVMCALLEQKAKAARDAAALAAKESAASNERRSDRYGRGDQSARRDHNGRDERKRNRRGSSERSFKMPGERSGKRAEKDRKWREKVEAKGANDRSRRT